MKYEFVSPVKISVPQKGKGIFLTVGIVCFVIAFIAELLIGNKYAFVFVVPLLYLLRLRGQLGGKQRVKDARITISICDDKIEFVLFSVKETRKGNFSERYSIPKSGIKEYCVPTKSGRIMVRFDGQIDWLDSNEEKIGPSNAVFDHTLELMAPDDVCYVLHQALKY